MQSQRSWINCEKGAFNSVDMWFALTKTHMVRFDWPSKSIRNHQIAGWNNEGFVDGMQLENLSLQSIKRAKTWEVVPGYTLSLTLFEKSQHHSFSYQEPLLQGRCQLSNWPSDILMNFRTFVGKLNFWFNKSCTLKVQRLVMWHTHTDTLPTINEGTRHVPMKIKNVCLPWLTETPHFEKVIS